MIKQQGKNFLFIMGLIFCFESQATITQYTPIASPEHHEIFISKIFHLQKDPFDLAESWGFNYDFYLIEINSMLPREYQNIFFVGVHLGASLTQEGSTSCSPASSHLVYRGGLKSKLTFFEYVKPFVEYGYMQDVCLKNFSMETWQQAGFADSSQNLQGQYVSAGLSLSFKILDRVSLYNLDQDYGLNDVALRGECLRSLSAKEAQGFVCELGLSFAF